MKSREGREKLAYEGSQVQEIQACWKGKFLHVFECPNTLRKEQFFNDLIKTYAENGKVLEIGCG